MQKEKKTLVPYHWLREIDPKIIAIDQVPLFGEAPSFPWKEYSQALGAALEINDLEIHPGEVSWKVESELTSDLGDDLFIQEISLHTIQEPLYLVIPRKELLKLISQIAGEEPFQIEEAFESEVSTALIRFLLITAVLKIEALNFDSSLSIQLKKESSLPNQPALARDLLISIKGKTHPARLLMTKNFLHELQKHWTHTSMQVPVNNELLKKLFLVLHFEIAHETLTAVELQQIKVGDVLLLKQCSINPVTKEGTLQVTFKGIPKYNAELKAGKVKITKQVGIFEPLSGLKKKPH